METTYGELQKYHNKEVTVNPDYRMEGMVDVSMERLLGYCMPVFIDEETEKVLEVEHEAWSQTQWDIINQMRAELTHLHSEIANLEKLFDVSSKPIKKGKYKKYE